MNFNDQKDRFKLAIYMIVVGVAICGLMLAYAAFRAHWALGVGVLGFLVAVGGGVWASVEE